MPDAQLIDEAALAQIEARAEAATEGPWAAYHRISPRGAYKHWHIGNKDGLCQITMNGHERDYEFIAHARADIPAMAATIRELWAEGRRLQIGFSNLYHVITGKYCDDHVALGMATSAVSALLAERNDLRQRLAGLEAEQREGETCENCDLPTNDEQGNPLTFLVCGRCWNANVEKNRQRLAEVEAERDRYRDEVDRADANIVNRAAQLSAQIVIDGAVDDYRTAVLALLDEKAKEWSGEDIYNVEQAKQQFAGELKGLVEGLK